MSSCKWAFSINLAKVSHNCKTSPLCEKVVYELTDVDSLSDVATVSDRVEVVCLVVDLQIPDATGISGVHLQEVIRVPEMSGSAKNDRLRERDPWKETLEKYWIN